MAPANLRDARVAAALLQFATRYAAQQTVPFDVAIPGGVPGSPDKLMAMEATHQVSRIGPHQPRMWHSNGVSIPRFLATLSMQRP